MITQTDYATVELVGSLKAVEDDRSCRKHSVVVIMKYQIHVIFQVQGTVWTV